MTNSDSRTVEKKILDDILRLLDEGHIKSEIDNPIDKAISQYQVDSGAPYSSQYFHKTISDYTSHIYEHGLKIPQKLSSQQALAEAIFLLERTYQGANSSGYAAALLEATHTEKNGIEWVLMSLSQIIKTEERKKYVRWIFANRLESADWSVKCQIARLLLDQLGPFLTPNLRNCAPAQIIDVLPELITSHLSTDYTLHLLPTSSTFVTI